ncbi:hypothetical protein VQ056_21690 [Paenibacillus sp. JTLBN-2024]
MSAAAGIAAQYDDYVAKANEDANRGEDEEPQYSDEIRDDLTDSSDVTSRLGSKHRSARRTATASFCRRPDLAWCREASELNEKMKGSHRGFRKPLRKLQVTTRFHGQAWSFRGHTAPRRNPSRG